MLKHERMHTSIDSPPCHEKISNIKWKQMRVQEEMHRGDINSYAPCMIASVHPSHHGQRATPAAGSWRDQTQVVNTRLNATSASSPWEWGISRQSVSHTLKVGLQSLLPHCDWSVVTLAGQPSV